MTVQVQIQVNPDDSALLRQLGIVLLTNLASFSTITLLHGIFIVVFSIAIHTILRRGLKSRPTLMMFILVIISFTSATIYWAAWMASVAIQIRLALVENIDMALSERFALANAAITKPVLIQIFLDCFMRIVNDTAVIWRAWVLFPKCQWVMVGPLFFLLATFVMTLIYVVMYTMPSMLSPNRSPSQRTLYIMDNCTVAISMVTNLLTTLLIGYKLWDHRKYISSLGLRKRSHVQKVLFLLVESGILFFGLQLASLLLSLSDQGTPDTAAGYAADVCYGFYAEFAAMHPALIFIIVNKERTMVVNKVGFSAVLGSDFNRESACVNNSEDDEEIIGHLVFASSPTESLSIVDSEQSVSFRHSTFPGGAVSGSNNSHFT